MNVYSDYCTLHPSVKYVIHEFCTPKQNGAYSWCLVLCQRELVYATSDKQVCLVHLQDFIMYHKSSMCSWYMQHMCVCRLFFCVTICVCRLLDGRVPVSTVHVLPKFLSNLTSLEEVVECWELRIIVL